MSRSRISNNGRGVVIVLSAPSGCGKTTVVRELLARHRNDIAYSISHTTRQPRPGEKNGKDYWFVTVEKFKDGIRNRRYLEWADVYGKYYGTPREFVEKEVARGNDVLLDIDTAGARQVMKRLKEAVFVFMLPPSLTELQRRLTKRNTNTGTDLKRRVAAARKEIRDAKLYDYVFTNDTVAGSVAMIETILTAEKKRIHRNKEVINGVYFS